MPAKRFIDTNVLLYALMQSENEKSERAKLLLTEPDLVISIQVVNEVAFNLLKKAQIDELTLSRIIHTLFQEFETVVVDKEIVHHASELRLEYSLSYWDSLIVSSALTSGCEILFSEDMHDGLTIQKQLKVINPFV
jgi:predicted nucleic acid-binding protein